MERIPAVKLIVADRVKNKTFDSEYILGEEIVVGERPTCFPFPDLDPLPSGPSEKWVRRHSTRPTAISRVLSEQYLKVF